jgi:hypothetical protein
MTLTISSLALVLWGVAAVFNIFAAVKIASKAPAFAIGFSLAAVLIVLGVYLDYFTTTPITTVAPLLLMATTFALLTPIAVSMLVTEEIIWSHHALRAAIFAAVWTVWLAR